MSVESGGPLERGAEGGGSRDPVSEFGHYLWDSKRPPRALHRASGFALLGETADEAGSLPHGSILLYPRFLAFLAGPGPPDRRSTSVPLPIGGELFARLSPDQRSRLFAPLRTPGSLLVRIEQIAQVDPGRSFGLPGISLETTLGAMRLGPHPGAVGPSRLATVGRLTRWEPRLLSLIRSLIEDAGARSAAV